MQVRLMLLLSLTITLSLSSRTRADDLGLDFTGGNLASPVQNQTLGWEFSLSSTQTVTALGMFDIGSDGLNSPHLVGIWTPSGTLLGSVTVGNASTPITSTSTAGRWIFEALGSPLVLSPGNYVLGVDYTDNTDEVMTSASNVTTATGLTFVRGRFANINTAGFDFPDATFPTSGGHFGPSLLLAVPEPASLALVGAGLLAAGLYGSHRWKNRKLTY